jgi:hypothetical protein
MLDLLQKHRAELSRALRNHHYECMDDGRVLFPQSGLIGAGSFRTWVNGADEQITPNVFTLAGLSYMLKAGVAQFAQLTALYVAPFSQNADPANTLTAATFNSALTEFINYDETARPLWNKDAEASQAIGNTTTPARFTISTGGGTVWGAALISASAKSSASGTLLPCAKFAAARVLLAADKLDIEYVLTAADGS